MNRITIAQLQALHEVAESGSVGRAAARLNLTQPTISLRLRDLERQAKDRLLEPQGRGVRLTRAGTEFLKKARLVLDAYARLDEDGTASPLSGALRIGLAEGFAVACLPRLVAAFTAAHPLLRPEWTVTTSSTLEQGLLDGSLDVAVVVDPVGDRRLGLTPLGQQPNCWAAAAGRVPAATGASDLAALTVVTTPPPTSMYRNTVGWFAASGLSPGGMCLCTSVNAAAQIVAAGIGIGIFPRRMIDTYQGAGALAPIPTLPGLPAGRVFVAQRLEMERRVAAAAAAILEQVTRDLAYFTTDS